MDGGVVPAAGDPDPPDSRMLQTLTTRSTGSITDSHPDPGRTARRDDPGDICRGAGERERPTIDEDTGEITLERWPVRALPGREDRAKRSASQNVAGMNENDENQPSSHSRSSATSAERDAAAFEGKPVYV